MKDFDLENLTDDEILEIYDNVASGGEDEELYIAAYSCYSIPSGIECPDTFCELASGGALYSYTNSKGQYCTDISSTVTDDRILYGQKFLVYSNATHCYGSGGPTGRVYCHQDVMQVK